MSPAAHSIKELAQSVRSHLGLAEKTRLLCCLLGLRRQPVGVTILRTTHEHEKHPARAVKTPMSYCSVVRLAMLGHGRKIDAARTACPGAARALGFRQPDEEFTSGARYHGLGLYAGVAQAAATASQVSLLPGPVAGVAVEPLETCANAPDLVLCMADAYQAMRLVQAYIFRYGPLAAPLASQGMQGVCAELTAGPLLAGSLNVSLLCSNTRHICDWGNTELGAAMPFSLLAPLVEALLESLEAAESDASKRLVQSRGAKKGFSIPVTRGAAYYLRSSAAKKPAPAGEEPS